jgi:hypothetical protein
MKASRSIARHPLLHAIALSLAVVAGTAALGACASGTPTGDIRVHSAADAKANLGAYKSYAWQSSDGVLLDRTGVWTSKDVDAQAEVMYLVNKNLRGRGMTVAREQPDLLVSLLIVADVNDIEAIKNERGEALSGFDPVGEGALVVELIDASTGKTVWIGGAEGEIRGSRSTAEGKERLSYAVDKLFEQMPP